MRVIVGGSYIALSFNAESPAKSFKTQLGRRATIASKPINFIFNLIDMPPVF
jgi:hypothetical protein